MWPPYDMLTVENGSHRGRLFLWWCEVRVRRITTSVEGAVFCRDVLVLVLGLGLAIHEEDGRPESGTRGATHRASRERGRGPYRSLRYYS